MSTHERTILKQLFLASPRGFCAGVVRAVDIVSRALDLFGAPIYVRHEVVHNRYVVEQLRAAGAVFVDELDQLPDGATVIFSAHGVPRSVEIEAEQRGLTVFDATCPLVTKVHLQVVRHARRGEEVVLIGHAGHPEVEGTMGRFETGSAGAIYLVESVADVAQLQICDPQRLFYVTQTTLSVDDSQQIIDALRQRFPAISGPRRDDICYATQSRQDAVKQLARQSEVVYVVGSPNSSNSNRLREVAEREGCVAYLIDAADEIQSTDLNGVCRVGVTAGASAPEILIEGVIRHLNGMGYPLDENGTQGGEEVVFPLPEALR